MEKVVAVFNSFAEADAPDVRARRDMTPEQRVQVFLAIQQIGAADGAERPDLREFVECLNFHKVGYLIVGAPAVSWYGFPRYTADIDFFIRADAETADRLLAVLRDFGFGSLPLTAADFTTPNRVVQLGQEPNRIDLMTSISGVTFEEAWATRVSGTVDNLPVQYIGLEALLRNKAASGRPKDRIDIEALRELDGGIN